MKKSPSAHLSIVENQPVLTVSGEWTVAVARPRFDEIASQLSSRSGLAGLRFDGAGLTGWDSTFVVYLLNAMEYCQSIGLEVDLSGLPHSAVQLVDLATRIPPKDTARRTESKSFLHTWGEAGLSFVTATRDILEFTGESMLAVLRLIAGKSRMRVSDLMEFLEASGPMALPIVSLISLLVGVILAFVGAVQLRMFGAQIFVADLVGLGMTREMGAMMAAIIMTGRTGAAYAAQLGTMQVNEEIDALQTTGINIMDFLVLPRLLALMITMPMLCLFANVVGILGGALVGVSLPDVTVTQYFHQTIAAVGLIDIGVGVFKSFIFGIVVAMSGCLRGMQCGRNATAVGQATTSAVVTGIVAIVVTDSLMTVIFDVLGI